MGGCVCVRILLHAQGDVTARHVLCSSEVFITLHREGSLETDFPAPSPTHTPQL